MENIYENMRDYGEKMEGKFSHKPHGDGIVISVTSPFVEEIHIESDDNIHNAYWETYSLLPPQAEHPEGESWSIYYNTEEQCYYRSEWQLINLTPEKPEWGYVWVQTDKEYIVKHARKYEELQAHYRSYHDIHKGQLCVFTGYAKDPNGHFKRPSTVESMFDRHKWFFNPWSFKVSLLDENTIDDFVEETPISKEMTDKMVLYHNSQRKDKRRAKSRELRQNFKNKLSNPWKRFTKQETPISILWKVVAIISSIIAIWALFFKDK